MIIQCPDCASRYRIKEMAPERPDAHLVCPNCHFHFSLIAPQVEGQSPTIVPGARLLLVDDARFFREMLVDLLLPLNLNIQLAASASEARAKLQKYPCDLLLLDLNLPDQNGLELIVELHKEDRLNETRILAMSGVFRREQDGVDAIRAGADDFLNKSFRPEELRNKVRKLLQG